MAGVFSAGGVLLTLSPYLPEQRRKVMLDEAGARFLIPVGEIVELPAPRRRRDRAAAQGGRRHAGLTAADLLRRRAAHRRADRPLARGVPAIGADHQSPWPDRDAAREVLLPRAAESARRHSAARRSN